MKHQYLISDHALERYEERGGIGDHTDLMIQLEHGIIFGAQKGDDEKCLLLPCGLLAMIKGNIVVTILTKEYGIANMQSVGIGLRMSSQQQNDYIPSTGKITETPESLQALAHTHVALGLTRKQRNQDLRAHGVDPNGRLGREYREYLRMAEHTIIPTHG